MFTDSGLENYTWVPVVGNGIGSPGTPNPTITIQQPSASKPCLTVSTVGGSYADGLAKLVRPLLIDPTNMGSFTYAYQIMTDDRTPGAAQALETTPRFFDQNGWNYPGDFQVNYEEGGMVQIWKNATDPWQDTGIVIGKYAPNEWYSVAINYAFDTVKHLMSIPWFSVNGKTYQVPAALQNVAAANNLNWPPKSIYLQKQLDLNSKGGAFSVSYKNIAITYPGT
jgi:hypothetical protein